MTNPMRPRQPLSGDTSSGANKSVYLDGAETFQQLERQPDSMAWIGS
jgi:hypothetical protein